MFDRYAIFYTPPPGPLADFGAAWLGWDSAAGIGVAHPALGGLDVATITAAPRPYGLHGTLKAPFRLLPGRSESALRSAVTSFAARHAAVTLPALRLAHSHGFTALRPAGGDAPLAALAAQIVSDFDSFRAPLTEAEIARRRQAPLTPRQDRQMLDWGYPHVFEDFHFHLTLSGGLPPEAGATLAETLSPVLMPLVPVPFVIDAVTLMGQDTAGRFHQIHRAALRDG